MPPADPLSQFSDDLRLELEHLYRSSVGRPDVAGVDIGYVPAKAPPTIDVRLHLHRKGSAFLPSARRDARLPTKRDGSRVARRVAPYELDVLRPLDVETLVPVVGDRTRMAMPLQPGTSVGGEGLPWGTIGAIVFREGRAHVLSSAHVLAVDERGALVAPRNPAYQPGLPRNGAGYQPVGALAGHVHGPAGDAAIAALDAHTPTGEAITACRTVRDERHAPVVVARDGMAALGRRVRKSGVASRVTEGVVDGIGYYFVGSTKRTGFAGFCIAPLKANALLSSYGDSGAVWFDVEDGHGGECAGVGVNVGSAETKRGTFAVACHLPQVLHALGASLDPGGACPDVVPCGADD